MARASIYVTDGTLVVNYVNRYYNSLCNNVELSFDENGILTVKYNMEHWLRFGEDYFGYDASLFDPNYLPGGAYEVEDQYLEKSEDSYKKNWYGKSVKVPASITVKPGYAKVKKETRRTTTTSVYRIVK